MRITGLLAVLPVCSALRPALHPAFDAGRPFRSFGLDADANADANANADVDIDVASLSDLYPAHTLQVPVDHFHNDSLYEPHTNDTFALRYWYDASHYQPGGPVLVLAAGETSGRGRLPFLQKGLLARLAQATHGIGVVLEHRYYGASFPYDNLTTASMRFLRTEQALADTAYFAKHAVFNVTGNVTGTVDVVDVSPAKAPWIIYGGSYAGAFAALARIIYPDVFWGAISSSGVTVAIHDYWEYYEAHRRYAPKTCISVLEKLIHAVDQILLAPREEALAYDGQALLEKSDADADTDVDANVDSPHARVAQLKTVFGLANVTHDDDFAAVLSSGLDAFQSTNWDPAVSSPDFGYFCGNLSSSNNTLLYPSLAGRNHTVQSLLAATTYRGADAAALTLPMLNFIGWVGATHPCPVADQDRCFGTHDSNAAAAYRQDDRAQTWRAWPYQYCTQWGYLATGAGVPADRLPLVSRLLTVDYLSFVCRAAFNITGAPDVASINKYGAYNVHYPHVAFVDGEADPWRAATVHAIGHTDPARKNTVEEPFLLIDGGAVHHWDENGLFPNETTADLPPPPIRKVQAAEKEFVLAWVAAWAEQQAGASSDAGGYIDDGRI